MITLKYPLVEPSAVYPVMKYFIPLPRLLERLTGNSPSKIPYDAQFATADF
jgi:hypothetical protein